MDNVQKYTHYAHVKSTLNLTGDTRKIFVPNIKPLTSLTRRESW